MTVGMIVQTMIVLGKMALDHIPGGSKYQIALDGISKAIDELMKVHGSEVTKEQLEGLRVTPKW